MNGEVFKSSLCYSDYNKPFVPERAGDDSNDIIISLADKSKNEFGKGRETAITVFAKAKQIFSLFGSTWNNES